MRALADDRSAARLELEVAEVVNDLWSASVGCLLRCHAAKESKVEHATAADLVRGGLKLVLGWKEELEGALFAGVGGWDVEVED